MPSQTRKSGEQPGASQPFTSEQSDIYLQGQRLTAFVSDYIVEATPQKIRREHGVEVQSTKTSATNHKGPKELRTLRPNQYLVLVRYLLDHGDLQVPRHVMQALKSLIRIRKVVCSWFQDAEDPQTIGDNEKHLHFVAILERVNQLLSPYEARKATSQDKDGAGEAKPSFKVAEDEVNAITTVFAQLESVEADDIEGTGPSLSEEALQSKAESAVDVFSAESKTKSRKEYKRVCETNWILHQCFLLREHIQQKWREVREGSCDLGTASVLTNTAVEIVERMQDALFDKCGEHPLGPALVEFYREHLSVDAGGKQRSEPATTKSKPKSQLPLFNFRAAWGLSESLIRIKHERILRFYLGEKFALGLLDLRQRSASGEWDEDASLYHHASKAFSQSVGWDRVKKDYPHYISSSISTINTLDHHKYGYLIELLTELEYVFNGNLRECTKAHPCHSSVEDNILKRLRMEVAEGTSSIPGAFALTLFVDIREIMGVDSKHLMKVDHAAERFIADDAAILKHEVDVEGLTEQMRIGPNTRVHVRFAEDPYSWFARSILCGHNRDVGPGCYSEGEFRFCVQGHLRDFLRQSPIACGRLELFLRLSRQYACTGSVDARETIKSCLHFYNAAYQLGDIDTRWPDMERIIETHGCETLFLGPNRPVTLEECIDRWRRVFGIDIDLTDVYAGRGKISKTEKRGFFGTSRWPLLNLLGVLAGVNDPHYWRKAPFEDVELVLSACQRHPNVTISVTPLASLDKRPLLERLTAGRRRLEPLHLLDVMEGRLRVEEAEMDAFDYVEMEQLCWKMLSRMHYAYVAQKVDVDLGSNSHKVHRQGRGQRESALLSTPLFQLAVTHDGIAKDVTNDIEKRLLSCGSTRAGPSRDKDITPLAEKYRQQLAMKRRPYDTSAKIMRRHIWRHGNDVTGVDGRKTREARHWVAVGTGLMLHTSPQVSKAVQRDELGTGRKCMMMLL